MVMFDRPEERNHELSTINMALPSSSPATTGAQANSSATGFGNVASLSSAFQQQTYQDTSEDVNVPVTTGDRFPGRGLLQKASLVDLDQVVQYRRDSVTANEIEYSSQHPSARVSSFNATTDGGHIKAHPSQSVGGQKQGHAGNSEQSDRKLRFKCATCGQKFCTFRGLRNHCQSPSSTCSPGINCPLCGDTFNTPAELQDHASTAHEYDYVHL